MQNIIADYMEIYFMSVSIGKSIKQLQVTQTANTDIFKTKTLFINIAHNEMIRKLYLSKWKDIKISEFFMLFLRNFHIFLNIKLFFHTGQAICMYV